MNNQFGNNVKVSANILKQPCYDFLRNTSCLCNNVIFLVLGGSHAYGLATEDSDIDVRGIFMNNPKDYWKLSEPVSYFEDKATDTVLYSFKKFVYLLTNNNPNTLELIGTDNDAILYRTLIADKIISNQSMFISKQCFFTFAGYSTQQLRRLQNALVSDRYPEDIKEQHIFKSIKAELLKLQSEIKTFDLQKDIELKINTNTGKMDISFNVNNVSLREFVHLNSALKTCLNNYEKLNHRNRKKDDAHLFKHACHLIRLLLSGIDILKTGVIRTKMVEHIDLLRSIRFGEMDLEKVFDLHDKLEVQLQKAYDETKLPDRVDFDKIDKFVQDIMYNILKCKTVSRLCNIKA